MRTIEKIIESDLDLVFAIGIVSKGAMRSDFLKLSDEEAKEVVQLLEEDKQIISGAVMIPNKPILRHDKEGKEYFIYFSADTIKQAKEKFDDPKLINETTLEHKFAIEGTETLSSWIVSDCNDLKQTLGLDVPVGTWMLSKHITDPNLWDGCKDGTFNGYSIEGKFSNREITELSAVSILDIFDEIDSNLTFNNL